MRKSIFVSLALLTIMVLIPVAWAEEESGGVSQDAYSTEQRGANISYDFEKDDIMATQDENNWHVGKKQAEGGTGKDREISVLFFNGQEAWVKPGFVITSFRLINQNEVKVGQRVLYTDSPATDWNDGTIRKARFFKGKITTIGKMHRNIIEVNGTEVRWDQQVLIW